MMAASIPLRYGNELTFSIAPRRHDRDDVKLVLLIHNASDLCRETKWSTFDEPTGETDGPCIDAFFRRYVGPPRYRPGRRRLARRGGLSIGGQLVAEHGECHRGKLHERPKHLYPPGATV